MDLLFDLDGTLTNPAEGITGCIQHSLRALGRESVPTKTYLQRYIGPPLHESFAELLETSDRGLVDSAITKYRERFADIGLYENELFETVPGGLASLREAGHRLWVATSKPQVFARRITDHFDLTSSFVQVYGAELGGTNAAKTDLIAHIIESEQLRPQDVCMIGDRSHDIVGGRANGTHTIGVLWGFGSVEELESAEADAVVDSMAALVATIEAMFAKGK